MNRNNIVAFSTLAVKQAGLSLVELMISVTLSLVIMAGVIQLYASASRTASTAEGASRLQENIRYTINHLGNNIARAGSMGCFSFSAVPTPAPQGTGGQFNGITRIEKSVYNLLATRLEVRVDPSKNFDSSSDATIVVDENSSQASAVDTVWYDFENSFISGEDNENNTDAAVLDGTDTLVLKFADASSRIQVNATAGESSVVLETIDDLSDGDVVLMGDCQRISVFSLSDVDDAGADDNTVSISTGLSHGIDSINPMTFLYAGESGAHRYYIGGENCDNNGVNRTNCSLFRSINGGAAQELVQGVHDMQVRYGYEGVWNTAFTTTADRRTVDRVEITFSFNAADGSNVLDKDIVHVFAVRNQL